MDYATTPDGLKSLQNWPNVAAKLQKVAEEDSQNASNHAAITT